MVTKSETAKEVIGRIAAGFKDFTSLQIGSSEFEDKVYLVDAHVLRLAQLHPRWSAKDGGKILPFPEKGDWFEYEQDPLFAVYESTEDLLWWWRKMDAFHPTAESLLALPSFIAALRTLCQETGNSLEVKSSS